MIKEITEWKLSVFPNKEGYLITSNEIVQTGENKFESVFSNDMIFIGEVDKEPGIHNVKIIIE